MEAWVDAHNALESRQPLLAAGVRQHRDAERTALDVVALVDGALAGVGSASEPDDRRGLPAGWSWVGVLPAYRRRGIGSALREVLSTHLRGLGKTHTDTFIWDDDAEAVAWATRRGFETIERFQFVRIDLTAAEPAHVPAPPGVEIVTRAQRPGLERGMFEVNREALADLPTDEPLDVSYDDFFGWEIAQPTRRADLTFVALNDGEVIGYATLGAFPGGDATHVMTAVKRAWRRRGVASALKAAQLRAAKAAGFAGVVTFNELRNDAMRALNERLGYLRVADQLRMRGPLG